jgi:hypothetical protein
MHGLLAVPDLGADGDLEYLGQLTRGFLDTAKSKIAVEFSDTKGRKPTVRSSKCHGSA